MMKELSAQELEVAWRKCVHMEVSDTAVLARVLDSMNLDYKIISIAKILTEKCGGQIAAEYHEDRLYIKIQL